VALPGEGEDNREAGSGGKSERTLRGLRPAPRRLDSRLSGHVFMKPDEVGTPL
jgi:hypothetical protein